MRRYLLGLQVVSMLAVLFTMGAAAALTDSDWATKIGNWFSARDNGSYTVTGSVHEIVNNVPVMQATTQTWFQDTVSGWSMRTDVTLPLCPAVTAATCKILDTPSGYQEFFNGIRMEDSAAYLGTSWTAQSHSTMPIPCYLGDPTKTVLQNVQTLLSSRSVIAVELFGTYAWRLSGTLSVTALNNILSSSQQISSISSATLKAWINANSGAPMKTEISVTNNQDNSTHVYITEWSSYNYSPSIPSGTFDLSTSEPNGLYFIDMYEDWVDANSGSC